MSTPNRRSKRLAGLPSDVRFPTHADDFDPTINHTKPTSQAAHALANVAIGQQASSSADQSQPSLAPDASPKQSRVIVLIGAVAVAGALWSVFGKYLSFDYLALHQAVVQERVHSYPWLAAASYVGLMGAVIGLTCPGATFLSFMGGFLFPQPYSAVLAYVGYNLGANLSYLTARYVLKDLLRDRLERNPLFCRFQTSVKKNTFVYIAVARFTLIFPFWFVNLASAVAGVDWASYTKATALSTLSGSIVYTCAGRALGNALLLVRAGKQIDTNMLIYDALVDPNVILCLMTLILCSAFIMSIGPKYKF